MATVKDRLTALKDTLGVKLNELHSLIGAVQTWASNTFIQGVNTKKITVGTEPTAPIANELWVSGEGFFTEPLVIPNGNFEDDLTGWTKVSGNPMILESYLPSINYPFLGAKTLYFGANYLKSELYQIVNLPANSINIDVKWYQLQRYNHYDANTGIILEFYNASDVQIGSPVSSPLSQATPQEEWHEKELTTAVPTGSAKVKITIITEDGRNYYGYVGGIFANVTTSGAGIENAKWKIFDEINQEWLRIGGDIEISDVNGLQNALDGTVKTTGNQTVGGVKTFSSAPKSSVAAVDANDLLRKGEVEVEIYNLSQQFIGLLALKANDNAVVKLTGNQTVAGKKTFTTVPASTQNAVGNNDLVRLSQLNLSHKIPLVNITSGVGINVGSAYLTRYHYETSSAIDVLITATPADEGKEVILTNASNQYNLSIGISSTPFYSKMGAGGNGNTSYDSLKKLTWIRARVMDDDKGGVWFLIVESGTIPGIAL